MTKLEQHKKRMGFVNFQILESLLSIVEKYEITNSDDILNYGKSAFVFQNFTKIIPKDEEHRVLRRTQINQSVNGLIDVLNNIEGEGNLSNLDKDEFDEIYSQILEGKELGKKHIGVGKFVVCDNLIYQITDIDYHDLTIKLQDIESDTWFWEKPTNCK
tara:strand:- start:4674 stop:5150 length:477 start_codon:yes stop_codon:yes gene_type:complete